MKNYDIKKLSKHDPQIKFAFQGTTENINFLLRLTGCGTSYLILFFKSKPIKILKGCQKTIIDAYIDLMNDKEIEVIKEMTVPSKRDLETFCRI